MLITLAELAASLQEDVDNATGTLAIEMATGAVQTAAGQRIVQIIDDVALLDVDVHDRGFWLDLPEGPVTAVDAVLVGTLPVVDYTVQLSRGRLWRAYGWLSATRPYWPMPSTVTVTYTHGYADGDQKLQLARAVVLDLAKTAYSTTSGATVVREQIDDYAVQYAAMVASVESALDPDGAIAKALRRQYGRRGRGSVRMLARR
jgi:hypothetical protein